MRGPGIDVMPGHRAVKATGSLLEQLLLIAAQYAWGL